MTQSYQRIRHPDFKAVEASRPDWDSSAQFHFTKTFDPNWKYGSGANSLHDAQTQEHVSIDPHDPGRFHALNYKLLLSSIIPRPIAFISSCTPDGSAPNLAPFSYFNMVNHDPPLFFVGIASPLEQAKDTLRNIVDSGECVINIISDHYLEAANSTCADTPYGVSEWTISGLTPANDCQTVKCARVREAVVSIETRLDTVKEYDSRARPGNKSGTVLILEGTRFWVRGDAINEERSSVDPAVLRPISRLGSISYGRLTEAFELPRVEQGENGVNGKKSSWNDVLHTFKIVILWTYTKRR